MDPTRIQRNYCPNIGGYLRGKQCIQFGYTRQYGTCTGADSPLSQFPGIHRKASRCTNSRGACLGPVSAREPGGAQDRVRVGDGGGYPQTSGALRGTWGVALPYRLSLAAWLGLGGKRLQDRGRQGAEATLVTTKVEAVRASGLPSSTPAQRAHRGRLVFAYRVSIRAGDRLSELGERDRVSSAAHTTRSANERAGPRG